MPAAPTPAALAEALAQAAARYGTPAYVYDLARIRARIRQLEQALPPGIEVRYSVKANPAPAVCAVIASAGLGAEVSSAGELTAALDAGFRPSRIMVSGPYKDPGLLQLISGLPELLISVDSVSELAQLAARPGTARRIVLRLRPDYPPAGDMCAGAHPRFGIPVGRLGTCLAYLRQNADCVGFHVYGGSQILDKAQAAQQLLSAVDLAMRAAELLDVRPGVLNIGGGFGVPYADSDELDLAPASAALRTLDARTPNARLVLELGRYLVADAGWYLTRVVHLQTYGDGPAVVVDGGIHHRPDLCGLDIARTARSPILLGPPRIGATPTAVLGCLCLPWDVLAYAASLPALSIGDVLAFPTAGAYGLTAAPTGFLGHRLPAEVSLDDGILTLLAPPWPIQRPQPAGVP
jgi:diaminopimelate decarboxylase